jgi:hypothetical protein
MTACNTVFHLKRNPTYSRARLQQHHETSGNTEFLQPYPVVANGALLEIGTVLISTDISLDENQRRPT